MTETLLEGMTLELAIQQMINLGERDPLDIAKKLEIRYGVNWVNEQLALYSEDILATFARERLNTLRRTSELALRPGDAHSQAEIMIRKFWVPGEGWKQAGELTISDLEARAGWYDKFAFAAMRRAAWLREVANMMREDNVSFLKELERELPALPENAEELDVLSA